MKKISNDKTWSLLVASPSLYDGIFEETVVLVLDDSIEGTIGVIINLPENRTLGEISPDFENSPLGKLPIFDGGPVGRERLSFSVWRPEPDGFGGHFDFGLPPDKVEKFLKQYPTAKGGVFLGCTGWAPNQLQKEIDEGFWICASADISLAFELSPNELWRELLFRECPEFLELPEPQSDPAFN